EMENFRSNFRDHSYFVALLGNGHYYYNNTSNDYQGQQFRYTLNPNEPDDAWFYRLIDEGRDFHLNVNPDSNLGVTKLWIDVLMRNKESAIVGMVGTGLNLDNLLQDIVDIGQQGITTLFVDLTGAIQLYRDRSYIDFATIVKPEGQKTTIDLLFDSTDDKQQVLDMLASLKDTDQTVETRFVTVNGRKHLAGAAFLPAIGWYEVTLIDLSTLLPKTHLWHLIAVFSASLLMTLAAFHLVIQFRILTPVLRLGAAVNQVRRGNFDLPPLARPSNEIGLLAADFEEMTRTLKQSHSELEQKIAERTEALHSLARVDSLTGLCNRRSLDEILEGEIQRASRQNAGFGVVWLDIDHFKAINDSLGHQTGDEMLCKTALWLQHSLRPYDRPGRWGGDEFMVVLSPCDHSILRFLSERLRQTIERESANGDTPITVSVGAYLCQPGDSAKTILHKADQALYKAKARGRNTVFIANNDPQIPN
ncbi:MAG TPA: diguanylate cyclase, partial [Marinobacter sp.]|nr:diguanylate cyclase [Marinobacter sp.]